MNNSKQLLSDLKLHSDYLRWRDDRYETWEEAIDEILQQHRDKYQGTDIEEYLQFFKGYAYDKKVLASQRNLQWRGKDIFKHFSRLYNCSTTYIDRPEVFSQILYLLLCGCGVGYSVEKRFVAKLPIVKSRINTTVTHVVEDSIEGWSDALNALMGSYFEGTSSVRFDYSGIRPKNNLVAGRFLAPGPNPLKKSLERVEAILESCVNRNLGTLEAHDLICHIADAVISAGLRRSALIALFDKDDQDMINCKTGNWFNENPQRARANNSVKLVEGQFTEDEYYSLFDRVKQFGEPGIIFVDDERFTTNPCSEISFIPINPKTGKSCISFCNLCEINAKGIGSEDEFLNRVKAAAIIGTLQSGYTDFPYLGKDTEELVAWECLLGISITGWFDNPWLFNEELLQKGASYAKEVNAELAGVLGINPSARVTTVKPSGNASVILGCSSGIHPAHSRNYFRIMQLNKDNEVSKWLKKTRPEMLEESVWSANNTDYVVYIPITEDDTAMIKSEVSQIEFLDKVKLVQQNWVLPGANDRGYSKYVSHNVSNTVSVDDWDAVAKYLYENRNHFGGVSFLPNTGDKIYRQAPFTSVLMEDELIKTYGKGCMFASGLIVDLLHAFDNDLWTACEAIQDKGYFLSGTHLQIITKKDLIRRAKKYAKNYFKGELDTMIECLKDVHLFHKWCTISKRSLNVDVSTLLGKPEYLSLDEMSAVACHGGQCDV